MANPDTAGAAVAFVNPLKANAGGDGVTFYAWSWNAGELVADPFAVADEKKDAASRVAATFLAAAAFAMY